MVVALGPGKFYGSRLPRPRFYTDVKLNDERVDPPPSVMDPLMCWARDAHWSMGGLNFERTRLQGRIEGNVEKLRAQREKISRTRSVEKQKKYVAKMSGKPRSKKDSSINRAMESPSPPPAPLAIKRRRVVGLVDEEGEGADLEPRTKGVVRKLGTDFERVAVESVMSKSNDAVASKSSGEKNGTNVGIREAVADEGKRKNMVNGVRRIGVAMVSAAVKIRSSPRLAKRRVTA